MIFNKEEKTRKVFLIDYEEVSKEAFYSSLEDAITNEYNETVFNDYLRDNYGDIEIEGCYYEPNEVLEAMGDYDSAYEEWLENKTQATIDEFKDGCFSSDFIYGYKFEIEEIEEAYINIGLNIEEVKKLYSTLNVNEHLANNSLAKRFIATLAQLIEEELHESEDLEEC